MAAAKPQTNTPKVERSPTQYVIVRKLEGALSGGTDTETVFKVVANVQAASRQSALRGFYGERVPDGTETYIAVPESSWVEMTPSVTTKVRVIFDAADEQTTLDVEQPSADGLAEDGAPLA